MTNNPSENKNKSKPPDWLIENIAEASRNARKIYLFYNSFLAYCTLTIINISDRQLVLNETVHLPLINTNVQLINFFIIAPLIAIFIFIYLQIYLHRIKGLKVDLRSNYSPIEKRRLYPWILNIAEDPESGCIGELHVGIFKLSVWWLLPIFLIFMTFFVVKKHDPVLSYVLGAVSILGTSIVVLFWERYEPLSDGFKFKFKFKINHLKKFIHKKSGITILTFSVLLLEAFLFLFIIPWAKEGGKYEFLRPFICVNLSYQKLVNETNAGGGLYWLVLKNVHLEGANLTGTVLKRVDLQEAHLQNAIIVVADLEKTNLFHANLQGANLQGANLQEAILASANLQNADLRKANLRKSKLLKTIAKGADFRDADLQETVMILANLQNADLGKANLQHAKIGFTNFKGANLEGINLQNVDFTFNNLPGANLQKANMQGAKLTGVNLQGANLQNANLQNADFSISNVLNIKDGNSKIRDILLNYMVKELSLNQKRLKENTKDEHISNEINKKKPLSKELLIRELVSNKTLEYTEYFSSIQEVPFTLSLNEYFGANLQEANLSSANLQGAKLLGANLQSADLTAADLKEASLVFANLQNIEVACDRLSYLFSGLIKTSCNPDKFSPQEKLNLKTKMFSKVKTLYEAKLDPKLKAQLKRDYPHLFEIKLEQLRKDYPSLNW
ncbi:secreted effector protein pipB2 [bacterium BMS3Bbin06]|nr:secreted effector protein pipB2 [bacterium BMS3Bbin06]